MADLAIYLQKDRQDMWGCNELLAKRDISVSYFLNKSQTIISTKFANSARDPSRALYSQLTILHLCR